MRSRWARRLYALHGVGPEVLDRHHRAVGVEGGDLALLALEREVVLHVAGPVGRGIGVGRAHEEVRPADAPPGLVVGQPATDDDRHAGGHRLEGEALLFLALEAGVDHDRFGVRLGQLGHDLGLELVAVVHAQPLTGGWLDGIGVGGRDDVELHPHRAALGGVAALPLGTALTSRRVR